MTVARSDAKPLARSRRLPEGKSHELLGLALVSVGLLLLVCLATYHPSDPSWLHQSALEQETRNWVGPFGAEVAALGYGLLGLPVLAAPVLLLVGGVRRLRRRRESQVVGRGIGAMVLLAGLPPLVQLIFETFSWRGVEMAAGGALGEFAARHFAARTGFVGALLILVSAMVIGLALVVQSSLGEILGRIGRHSQRLAHRSWLLFERTRERREKERSRQRVVAKHLERARRRQRPPVPTFESFSQVRVTEPASAAVKIATVASEPPEAAARPTSAVSEPAAPATPRSASRSREKAAARARGSKPQSQFGFADSAAAGELPPLNLLALEEDKAKVREDELVALGELIRARCAEFGVEGSIEGINPGPVITVFEYQPAPGVKVSQIVNLQDDLALSLKAESIRIDRIPGRSTLGIEVPNEQRTIIRLGALLGSDSFRSSPSPLTMAIGKTLQGEPYYGDLATMPHLLVAGATGAGKSVGLQSMITSIIYKATRDQVQFIFIDPKRIELGVYADVPHLKTEVVVEPKKAANALRWAVAEMERRYRLLAEVHVRSIDFYNRAILDPKVQQRLALKEEDEGTEAPSSDLSPLPYYVVIIDELADLMMVSSSEVEQSIARLAQMARAVGIHLIVATQRPSVDVLTGTIKANFPCRMSFATATRHDSRTILDQVGAEQLLGKGDMLFLPPGSSRPIRLHGAYVSEQETAALVRWLKKQGRPELDMDVLKAPVENSKGGGSGGDDGDELFDQAARLVVAEGYGSASFLQRRMRVGFSRAARLIDMLERDGILGPAQGSKPREALVKPDFFAEIDEREG